MWNKNYSVITTYKVTDQIYGGSKPDLIIAELAILLCSQIVKMFQHIEEEGNEQIPFQR